MFHAFDVVQNTKGDSLIGYQVALKIPATGAVVPIFADDAGTPISVVSGIANVALTDGAGNYDFFVPFGTYTIEVRGPDAVLLKVVQSVPFNSGSEGAPGRTGDTGPADNTYSDLSLFKASDIARATASLVGITGVPDGRFNWTVGDYTGQADGINIIKADAQPLSVGAWVRQGSEGITYDARQSVKDKLDRFVYVTDARFAGGAKGDGIANDTLAIQAAINAVESAGGGVVNAPAGIYLGNWTVGHQVEMRGVGGQTIFRPFIADHGFKTPLNKSVTRIRFTDLRIEGNPAHANCDGIHLEAAGSGNFVDDIVLQNVTVTGCGRDGIRAVGTASAGPFVQRLKMDNCVSRLNRECNLRMIGTVLESKFTHCAFSSPTNTAGDGRCVSFEFNGDYPLRAMFDNCIIDCESMLGVSGKSAFGVYLGAAANIHFQNCNFEFCDPHIYTVNFVYAFGFTAEDCNFAVDRDASNAILLLKSRATAVRNCTFRVASGFTLTNAVHLDGDMEGLRQIELRGNVMDGAITNYVFDPSSFFQTISNGTIKLYRDYITMLGEGAAPFTDDLDSIVSGSGSTTRFASTDIVTLAPFAGFESITVKHGTGNLLLSGGADYALNAAQKTITFRWNTQRSKWVEISRS